MEWLVKIGPWGCLGFIVSLGVVTWLGADLTSGGAFIIIALCISVFLVLGGVVNFFIGIKK